MWQFFEKKKAASNPTTVQRERRQRSGYLNSAIDSTNRTRSTCREIGSFW